MKRWYNVRDRKKRQKKSFLFNEEFFKWCQDIKSADLSQYPKLSNKIFVFIT